MDIDLVYLWVNGNDPVWRARKNAYVPEEKREDPQVAGACRYFDNDELRYSLRSVEAFAPWIRRIYIITDDQSPSWLDTSNPRVRLVSHREIMPADLLPVFSSTVLEWFLPQIPGLSEHFLYANDDYFFSRPVGPDFFFDEQGLPIVRLKVQSLKRHDDDIYCHMVSQMQRAVRARYGRCTTLAPHHNVDAYRRSDYLACIEAFDKELEATRYSRFRHRDDWQRSLVSYYMLACGRATMRRVTRFNRVHGPIHWLKALCGVECASDSRCMPANLPDLMGLMQKYSPSLFCLNDTEGMTDADRGRARDFLERFFPRKSQFEK